MRRGFERDDKAADGGVFLSISSFLLPADSDLLSPPGGVVLIQARLCIPVPVPVPVQRLVGQSGAFIPAVVPNVAMHIMLVILLALVLVLLAERSSSEEEDDNCWRQLERCRDDADAEENADADENVWSPSALLVILAAEKVVMVMRSSSLLLLLLLFGIRIRSPFAVVWNGNTN
jgi:hypothetical protein